MLKPENADAHNNRGIVLQEQGRLEAALDSYRRALELDPSHADAHVNIGRLLHETGDLAAAEATAIAGENAPDLVVRLTIDSDLQLKAQTIVTDAIARQGHALNASHHVAGLDDNDQPGWRQRFCYEQRHV